MKTLSTDRALVTSWLLAQGGLPLPAQQASPAPVAPTVPALVQPSGTHR